MNSQARCRWVRLAAGATVALAAAWLAPGRAEAGCAGHPAGSHDPLSVLNVLNPPGPSPAPEPCRGPSCSGRGPEDSPTPLPVLPVSTRGEPVGLPDSGFMPHVQGSRLRVPPEAVAAPPHGVERVDRPPRSSF